MDLERLRASDADRERSAEVLRNALAEGRINHEELDERLDRVYRATTVGELAEITRDLPSSLGASPASGTDPSLSSAEAQQLAAQSRGKEAISAVFGGLRIIVPPGVRVVNQANVFLGGVDLSKVDSVTDPSAPTIRITGTCLMGGIQVLEQRPGQKCR